MNSEVVLDIFQHAAISQQVATKLYHNLVKVDMVLADVHLPYSQMDLVAVPRKTSGPYQAYWL